MICEFDYINYFVVSRQCQAYAVVQIMFLPVNVHSVDSYGSILLKWTAFIIHCFEWSFVIIVCILSLFKTTAFM